MQRLAADNRLTASSKWQKTCEYRSRKFLIAPHVEEMLSVGTYRQILAFPSRYVSLGVHCGTSAGVCSELRYQESGVERHRHGNGWYGSKVARQDVIGLMIDKKSYTSRRIIENSDDVRRGSRRKSKRNGKKTR